METNDDHFKERKDRAQALYKTNPSIYNPYLEQRVTLNSDGFHHLQFSARRERKKKEQLLKFSLLPLALQVIRKPGTVQEYRTCLSEVGKKSARGETVMKKVQYWGFDAIIDDKKIRTVLRQVGDGNIIFWSVMPLSKKKNGTPPKLYTNGIEDM